MTLKAESAEENATASYISTWPQHLRSGVWLTDERGTAVLSCFCAGGTFNFGFHAQDIRSTIISLIQTHDAGIWALPSEKRDEGERQFAAILPPPLKHTYFVSCASEAFEVACKLAKRTTGRNTLISAKNGYHGHVGFSLAMDDPVMLPESYGPLAGNIRKAVYGSFDSLESLINEDTAAVCLETVQVPGGVIYPPDEYFQKVRRLCDKWGSLLILDEVQGGFCRTGKIWAVNHYGVVPDIMVTGKGITGGFYPCGAMSYTDHLKPHFCEPNPVHISSYAGNELGAQLAGALAKLYADPSLCDSVERLGSILGKGLRDLASRYCGILKPEVRGRGLLWAVDVQDSGQRATVTDNCMKCGLFVRGTSLNSRAIIFQPPLVISEREANEALTRFESGLKLSELTERAQNR